MKEQSAKMGRIRWTLIFVIYLSVLQTHGQEEISVRDLCAEPGRYALAPHGKQSTLLFAFNGNKRTAPAECGFIVRAPQNYLLNMQIVSEGRVGGNVSAESAASGACPLYVYNASRHLVWTADPCHQANLIKSELLASDLQVTWVRGRPSPLKLLVLTAVAVGGECNSDTHFQCWHSGLLAEAAAVCVARDLLCDGIVHCPAGTTATDEDRHICKIRQLLSGSLESRVRNLYKEYMEEVRPSAKDNWRLTQDNIRLINAILSADANAVQDSLTTEHSSLGDSLTGNLSKYSPWSYLTLCMLVSASILIFCSFYRCILNKPPKFQHNASNIRTSIIVAHPQPQPQPQPQPPPALDNFNFESVEVVTESQAPPHYDDLDFSDCLLPSYSSLFPNGKERDCLRKHSETHS